MFLQDLLSSDSDSPVIETIASFNNEIPCLFERVRRSRVPVLILRSHAVNDGRCCDGRVVEILAGFDQMFLLESSLKELGFVPVTSAQTTQYLPVVRYSGYCEICGEIVRLQLSTTLSIAGRAGPRLVFNNSPLLMNLVQPGMAHDHIARAVEAISLSCEAAIVADYRTRKRRSLLHRCQALFVECSSTEFTKVANSLVGQDATQVIVALMSTGVNWEIDLFLAQLRRELKSADEVILLPERWFAGMLPRARREIW